MREIRRTARLTHPHILPLFDSGEADGFLYFVMPLLEGESLRERINETKQLPIDEAVQIAREVADALDYAHRHDVVHRDIKPENIMIHDGHAVVADFGIGKAVSAAAEGADTLTQTGVTVGTPAYRNMWALANLVLARARAGDHARASLVCNELSARAKHEDVPAFQLATAYAAAGRMDEASAVFLACAACRYLPTHQRPRPEPPTLNALVIVALALFLESAAGPE